MPATAPRHPRGWYDLMITVIRCIAALAGEWMRWGGHIDRGQMNRPTRCTQQYNGPRLLQQAGTTCGKWHDKWQATYGP